MIQNFVNYLSINRGLSQHTVRAYEANLREFAKYIATTAPGTRWSTVTKKQIDDYVRQLVAEGLKPTSIKQHIAAIRTFYKTIKALGYDGTNPAQYVSTPKRARQLPKLVEPEAINAMLNSSTVMNTKAIVAIIWETGIRLSELQAIRAQDIDSRQQSIKIHGKGKKERTVYYGELTKRYGRYLRVASMTPRDIRQAVYEGLRPYSQAEQLSPHAIRHSFATRLLNNGAPIEVISKLLGHESVTTTEIYCQLSNETTRQLYRHYS